MITLYGFGNAFNVADPSPFVLKTDAFLRMAKIPYQYKGSLKYLRTSPKGKLPFIKDNNKTICDSEFIFAHLKEKYDVALDEWLTEEQAALSHIVQTSLNEHLYWCVVYARWIEKDGWDQSQNELFRRLPAYLKPIAKRVARKKVRRKLNEQGLGRHSKSEIESILRKYLAALATLLDGKNYLMGDQPCTLDAAAFGMLAQLIIVPVNGHFNAVAREYQALVDYCDRILANYYSG